MTEQNSQNEKPQKERRYDPELLKKGLRCDLDQYDMLKRCSDKRDMTEWNEWRKEHLDEDIFLEGGNFKNSSLNGVLLMSEIIADDETNKFMGFRSKAYLKDSCFKHSDLRRANLNNAYLNGALLIRACLENANLAHARLEKTAFHNACLEHSSLKYARLNGARFRNASLKSVILTGAHIQNTRFRFSNLKGTQFEKCIVDGATLFEDCRIDHHTDFRGVGLDVCRIGSATKQLLEYNIRRKNWEGWYPKQHRLLAWLVRKFWEISDYGISTKHIIWTFFKWAFAFAIVYYAWGIVDHYLLGLEDNPGVVSNLFVLDAEKETVSPWLVPFRAVYFSIVTMTTLGFGDMYASAHGFLRGLCGHVLLALQVILGYVLLGALVTRFAVLFTAGGPAGKFADEKKEATEATEGTEKNE